MTKKIDQQERAAISWPILIECVHKGRVITYGQLAARMGVHPRVCGFFLGIIQDYCIKNSLPPLQSLVVNKKSGKPGGGYIASPRNKIDEAHREVFEYNWNNIHNPFETS